MELDLFHIDSFTERLFEGNPACVVPLESWLPDELMLNIAAENGVAETAFIVSEGEAFGLRWFTPDLEMDLCGHATLAAAHAIRTAMKFSGEEILFDTASGRLKVKNSGGKYILDFPARPPKPASLPDEIKRALNIQPELTLKGERDYVLVYGSERSIRNIVIDRAQFDRINLGQGGVSVTAPGGECDFVSRFFTPQATILEDYVTGSAHCSLVPYWSARLEKRELVARQVSARPGTLYCVDNGGRILIGGHAATYSTGKIRI